MAKLYGPINPDAFRTARGVLDYAVTRGTPYVRAWPNKPQLPRSPAVQATAAAFADYSRRVQLTAPALISALPNEAVTRTWTWKDALTAAIYGKLYRS